MLNTVQTLLCYIDDIKEMRPCPIYTGIFIYHYSRFNNNNAFIFVNMNIFLSAAIGPMT